MRCAERPRLQVASTWRVVAGSDSGGVRLFGKNIAVLLRDSTTLSAAPDADATATRVCATRSGGPRGSRAAAPRARRARRPRRWTATAPAPCRAATTCAAALDGREVSTGGWVSCKQAEQVADLQQGSGVARGRAGGAPAALARGRVCVRLVLQRLPHPFRHERRDAGAEGLRDVPGHAEAARAHARRE